MTLDGFGFVTKMFGHFLDTVDQGCGKCWLIEPVATPAGAAPVRRNFGTCSHESYYFFLMMSFSKQKSQGQLPE